MMKVSLSMIQRKERLCKKRKDCARKETGSSLRCSFREEKIKLPVPGLRRHVVWWKKYLRQLVVNVDRYETLGMRMDTCIDDLLFYIVILEGVNTVVHAFAFHFCGSV